MPLTYTQTPYSNLQGSVVNNEVALDYSTLDFRPEIGDTIEVYNDTTKLTETTNYTIDTSNTDVILKVNTFTPGTTISVYRISKKDTRAIDFQNASVLTEADLDNSAFQTFHIAQEALDTAEQSITVNADGTFNANNARIVNLADPSGDQDAATKAWVNSNANVTTVTTNIANVNHVAGQISPDNNVGAVAGKIADVETVAHLEDGTTATGAVSAVAGKSSEIEKLGTSAMATATTGHLARIGTDQHTNSTSGTLTRIGTDQHTNSTTGTLTRLGTDQHTNSTTGTLARLAGTDDTHTNTSTGTLKLLGTSANVTAMSNLGTSTNVTNMANLNATGVVDDLATLGSGKDGKSVGTSGYDSGTKTNIEQIHTVAQQIADVNNFADTYFGTSSSASGPTGTFTAGDLYFSTYNSENKLKVYNGSSWQNATSAVEGVATITEFTPNGTDTHFAFTHDVGLQIVFLNGVRLIQGTDYNSVNSSSSTSNITSGTASHLHFSTPPANGDVLSAMGFGTVTSTAVVPVSGGTFSGNVAVNGDLTVDTNTLKVDSTTNKVGIGEATPQDALHIVESSTRQLRLEGSAPSQYFKETGTTDQNYQLRLDDGKFLVQTNNDNFNSASTKLTIDQSGDVGIGVSSSLANRLHVEKAGSTVATFRTSNNNSGGGIELVGKDSSGAIKPFYIQSNASAELLFLQDTGATERMKIESDGDVKINTGNLVIGTSGKGINFSAFTSTAGSASRTESTNGSILNSYEFGYFTPMSNTYASTAHGIYVKVGRTVTCHCFVNISTSSSNQVTFNMPFKSVSTINSGQLPMNSEHFLSRDFQSDNTTYTNNTFGLMLKDLGYALFYTANPIASLSANSLNGNYIRFTISYITAD